LKKGFKLNALGSQTETSDIDLQHQRAVLQVLMAVAMPAGLSLAAVNFYREIYFLAVIELGFSIAALLLWNRAKASTRPRFLVTCFTIPTFAVISYAIHLPETSITIFAWVYIVPVLAYSAMGPKQGFYFSAVFYLSVGGQYFMKFGQVTGYQDVGAILNVTVCSTALWGFVHAYETARFRSHRRLSLLATTDPLTGLNNRLGLESLFEQRTAASSDQGNLMGLIMMDLDLFKSINDTYGHECGDEVLRRVATVLKSCVRADDVAIRMGGEEFCLLVACKDKAQLLNTANVLRERLQSLHVPFAGKSIAVTGSIGAVVMDDDYRHLSELLVEADRRLYRAKANGRNQVVFEHQHEQSIA